MDNTHPLKNSYFEMKIDFIGDAHSLPPHKVLSKFLLNELKKIAKILFMERQQLKM